MLSPVSFNPTTPPSNTNSSKSVSQLANNIASCTNTCIPMEKMSCVNIENQINVKWSSHLSNDDMLDFIWFPKINLDKLSRPSSDSEYTPNNGGSVIFMHSDGCDLFIKNNRLSPLSLSKYITRLDYYFHTSSPLILAACKAGYESEAGSIAQKLANALGREIIASPGMVHAECNDEKTHIVKICSDKPFLPFAPSNRS